MMIKPSPRRHLPSLVVLLMVVALASPLVAQPPAAAAGTSSIVGKVLGVDGSPLLGGTVVAYHLATEKVFHSAATDAKGEFALSELPYGYYDLAVQTPDGLYVAQVLNVPPSGKVATVLRLSPYLAGEASREREFPGATEQPTGRASVTQRPTGRDFWRSPKGVAIIAGGGGLLLLGLAAGGGSDASPVQPIPSQ